MLESSRRAAAERERRASTSTYQTEKTERFDLEESGEFLQAVEDPGRTAQNILDELDYQVGRVEIIGLGGFEIAMLMQAMEEMQTRLHPPNSSTHFSYNRVPWKLKVFAKHEWRKSIFNSHLWVFQIRKEVFSPSEQLTNPTTIHLVFCQAIKTIKLFAGVLHAIPHIDEPRDGQSKRKGICF